MTQVSDSGRPRAQVIGSVMRAPKTAELIASHLRRQIVRGDLAENENLPSEAHLMQQYGVSRPTLREAYRILEAEAILGIRRGARGGAQVLRPGPFVAARHVGLLLQLQGTTIRDVYDARLVSEPACVRRLAQTCTKADLADLAAIVQTLDDLVADGDRQLDPELWSQATSRFHQLLMERCGNNTLALQNAVLAEIVDTHLHLTISRDTSENQQERLGRSIRSYRKLLLLLEQRDAESAEQHWRRHMEVAAEYMFRSGEDDTQVVDLFG